VQEAFGRVERSRGRAEGGGGGRRGEGRQRKHLAASEKHRRQPTNAKCVEWKENREAAEMWSAAVHPRPVCDGVTRRMQPPRHNTRGHAGFPHRHRRHCRVTTGCTATPRGAPVNAAATQSVAPRRPRAPPAAAGRGRGTHGARALDGDGLCRQVIGGGVARQRRQDGGGGGRGRWRGRGGCGSTPPTHTPQGSPMAREPGGGEGGARSSGARRRPHARLAGRGGARRAALPRGRAGAHGRNEARPNAETAA